MLDLKYEARDVPQRLTSQKAIDAWFEQKTKGLNNFQKAVLRKRWATMEELMSAGERKQRIIANIIEDFSLKPRLNNDRGTAILVAASIYDACHYFRLFQNTSFGQYCGIITSYEPNHNAISREPANSDERYKFDTYTQHVLKNGQTTKQYEDEAKRRFIEEPANLKLLIVVSKLLTGFDAPSCTYIYLDNELHDHNLFQAICRTNRLDGDDKDYGHIVDFKELFEDVQEAIAVYSSDELDIDEGSGGDNNVQLKDWLKEGKKQLDAAREALRYLCEPVPPPREVEQFLHYFCGDAANPNALTETEPLRISFYKAVATFVRAYAAIAQDLDRGRLLRRRGRRVAEGGRVLQRHPRRHQEALGRGAGHQALRGGHAPPPQHLRPGRPGGGPGQPELAVAHRADHRDRHPRRHRPQAEREGQAVAERHRRGHHQQRPQDDHPRPAHRPEVLRADVEAAG